MNTKLPAILIFVLVASFLVLACGSGQLLAPTIAPTLIPPTSTPPPTATLAPTLTPEPTLIPTATPVPQRIVFSSLRGGDYADLYVMNADGSNVTRLTNNLNGADDHPVWSPDGLHIAYDSVIGGYTEIYVMDADGRNLDNLTHTQNINEEKPAWSPDGTHIAFSSVRGKTSSDIYVMNADGSNVIPLTNDPAREENPTWSPDGARIAFEHNSLSTGEYDIYVMNADGSQAVSLTQDLTFYALDPAWSPDGTQIAFFCQGDGIHYGICLMNADGSNVVQLGELGADRSPAWSPDGKQIAFVTDRNEPAPSICSVCNYEIYVMDADGSHVTRLTDDSLPDTSPAWSPD